MKRFILLLLSLSVYSQEVDTVEEIVTVGTKASLKSAINKQRDADQVVSIVDSDALGEFPDETAAEAVRRLSGVNVEMIKEKVVISLSEVCQVILMLFL